MQNQNKHTEPDTIKIMPLGGVEEIGINCTAFEYKGQIIVVDMGLGFPNADMYGVDYVVPNISYLEQRKDKIDGIFITHGHLDHIGALPYLLPRLDYPDVFGSKFTIEMIKAKLKDRGIENKAKLYVIDENSVMQSKDFKVNFFRVNHSIPQCLGLVIKTPAGRIVHSGDFKFDNSPVNEPVADYARMAEIGKLGVDLLLSDSTNSLKKGHPISEGEVARSLEAEIERAKGRVVIASFSGLVGRLYQLIKIAEKLDRKVAIAGYGMNQTLNIAMEIGYIKPKKGVIVPLQRINKFNDDRVMLLTTGSQGESNAALARMAAGDYRNIKIKDGDTVILSAGTIPGNHIAVQELIDQLSNSGAKILHSPDMDFFTSGHGYQEDQKIMLNLIKPKYFMPVHGYQYFLREHGRTAVSTGVNPDNVIISKRGTTVEGNFKKGFKITGNVKTTPMLVSGSGVGDVGTALLTERTQLGNHGVLVINLEYNAKSTSSRKPKASIITKGFVYERTSRDLLKDIQKKAENETEKFIKKSRDQAKLRSRIELILNPYIKKEIGREPMLIITLNEDREKGIKNVPSNPTGEHRPVSQNKSNGKPHERKHAFHSRPNPTREHKPPVTENKNLTQKK